MTITEQMRALDDRIVREAIAELRKDAERQEIVNRIYRVPEDAVEAMRLAKLRLRYLRGEA